MLIEKQFDAGSGIKLNYAEGPPSEHPLLLLHGLGSRWQTFLHIMPNLLLRWHVHAIDLRGHGRSTWGQSRYRLDDYAQDITNFIEQKLDRPAVIMGHSLGAMTAIKVAFNAPDAIRAIVLEDPPLFSRVSPKETHLHDVFVYEREMIRAKLPFSELLDQLANMPINIKGSDATVAFGDLPSVDAAYLRYAAHTLSMVDPEIFTATLERTQEDWLDEESDLPRLQCPVLLLQAERALGGALSDDAVRQSAALIAQCIPVSVSDVEHNIHRMKPQEMFRILSSFFESL